MFHLAFYLPTLLPSHLSKRFMWSMLLHLVLDQQRFNFHYDKEISSEQTAAPEQQLRYQSPEASHSPPKHCVHTPLFLPPDTLQTIQHVVEAIHCTVCSEAVALKEYLPLLPWALVLPVLHGEKCPNSTNPIHSIWTLRSNASTGKWQKWHWDFL